MKPVKQFAALVLALIMLAGLPQVIFAAPKVGDVVDYVLHTDIVTYINGLPIRSYNIKGYTAVIVEELADYGFYVVWYGNERKLTVIRLDSIPVVGGYTPEKNTQPIGSKAMPVYFTDIVTYLDGEKVDSYNVGGRTIIYVDDLAKFYAKDYVWDPNARTLSLTLKGAAPTDSYSGDDTGTGTEPSGGPVIEKQPESCSVKEGEYASFEVKASGDGLTYQWQREEADSESTAWNWVDLSDGGGISGAKTSKLSVLADLDAIYAGSYSTRLKVKANGELHWIDIKDYVVGEGLTFEWEGRRQLVPENLYIVETEYRVDRHEKGFEDQIIRTEVNGSKLGISTTALRGRIKKKNPGPLEGYFLFYSLDLYTELYCHVTDRYGEKLTFTVYIEYLEP
ncbi:MAG: hypothetical protein GX827_09485 [Clostridiales bacterium]|jgi:hypothetical protein|nr:hypothetical protein [Clostridiales bacterium]